MKRNRPHGTASRSTMAEDWEPCIDLQRMNRDRLGRVVTKDGCEVVTSFPPDRLLSCGMPRCEAF